MRTLAAFIVGGCLVAGPALAEYSPWVPRGVLPNGDPPTAYHPWVPSCVYTRGCVYTGSLPNGDAPARIYDRARSGDR